MMMTRAPMGPMEGAAVDEVVRRLVEGGRGGRQVQLSEAEIRQLCVEGKRVLLSQPNLLRIHAPVKICGNRRRSLPYLSTWAMPPNSFPFSFGPPPDSSAVSRRRGIPDVDWGRVIWLCYFWFRGELLSHAWISATRDKKMLFDRINSLVPCFPVCIPYVLRLQPEP